MAMVRVQPRASISADPPDVLRMVETINKYVFLDGVKTVVRKHPDLVSMFSVSKRVNYSL